MTMIEIVALQNGAHRNQTFHGILPDGWAVIPEDMVIPETFPFVNIEAEEITHYRDVQVMRDVTKTREVEQFREVTKTREVPVLDDEGNPVLDEDGNSVLTTEEYTDYEPATVTEEYTEMEMVVEEQEYTMMTVTAMTEGTLPEPEPEPEGPETEPSVWDELDAAYQEGVNAAYDE